jgi:hypothetical protein
MRRLMMAFVAASLLLAAGCASIGQDFPVAPVAQIETGNTTREEIRAMFGEPWRTGLENGDVTWTYAHYTYSAFGPEKTRDLLIRFDDEGKVVSYTFNSTYPEDRFEK